MTSRLAAYENIHYLLNEIRPSKKKSYELEICIMILISMCYDHIQIIIIWNRVLIDLIIQCYRIIFLLDAPTWKPKYCNLIKFQKKVKEVHRKYHNTTKHTYWRLGRCTTNVGNLGHFRRITLPFVGPPLQNE